VTLAAHPGSEMSRAILIYLRPRIMHVIFASVDCQLENEDARFRCFHACRSGEWIDDNDTVSNFRVATDAASFIDAERRHGELNAQRRSFTTRDYSHPQRPCYLRSRNKSNKRDDPGKNFASRRASRIRELLFIAVVSPARASELASELLFLCEETSRSCKRRATESIISLSFSLSLSLSLLKACPCVLLINDATRGKTRPDRAANWPRDERAAAKYQGVGYNNFLFPRAGEEVEGSAGVGAVALLDVQK